MMCAARLFPLPLAAAAALTACLGFDASPPPAATLTFALDLPAGARADVSVIDENDVVVGAAEDAGRSVTTITLTPSRDFASLRLVARGGERVLKAVAVDVTRDDAVDLGKVDAASTSAAQLIQHKVAGQGGSFSSIPTSAVRGLVDQVKQGGPQIKAFTDLVRGLLAKAPTAAQGSPIFHPADARLDHGFVKRHAKDLPRDVAADYQSKLAAATSRLTIDLVCDAAFVKVMFTVDASGEALDGNGAPQLIRQTSRSGQVYLAITLDDSSPVPDGTGTLKANMTPNDPATLMFDDGTGGDEVAGDGVFTRVLVLPRGLRVKYKYTNGSAGEGWTRTEEWPGNARILEVRDVLSKQSDGTADCLVIRRDVFGDEASNKNYVNLHATIKGAGGTLGFDKDLGGSLAAKVAEGRYVGGLDLGEVRKKPPLTPAGLPEAVENGVCTRCPAPLVVDQDDNVRPKLLAAEFTSTSRIKVTFSEAMEYISASASQNYMILDGAGRALAIKGVVASGGQSTLSIAAPDFGQTYTLYVKNLRDASARQNPIQTEHSSVPVGRDLTPPQIVAVDPLPLTDFSPGAKVADPTVGHVLRITFDEEVDRVSAENVGNYTAQGLASADLKVLAAHQRSKTQVWLITSAQGKRKPYQLLATGVRDLAGNLLRMPGPRRFAGFALYKVTFGAVPGFAFLDLAGTKRGLPSGAKLYLTGTVLSVARDLTGARIGVAGRTDLTGIPEFEMKPGKQVYKGKPVYSITLLAPPGTYAWKVAHGVEGEYKNPPTTLVKVHKSLCTTNDATGVNIDPATLTALPLPGSDGKPVSYLDYGGASLSRTGGDAPGPFIPASGAKLPAPTTMFKRENPDEVCSVSSADRVCPAIVVGTWRDIAPFKKGAKTDDYDDGLPEVPPVRLSLDQVQPALQNLKVRDSESLLLSFDERLLVSVQGLKISAREAKSGAPLKVSVEKLGAIGSSLLPHQLLLRTDTMKSGLAYALTWDGVADVLGNKQKKPLQQSWVAPPAYKPFTPLKDASPPKVIAVLPKSPTSLVVQFDEKILPADGNQSANFTIQTASGTAPTVQSATLQGGGAAVQLSTSLQAKEAPYTLVVTNISDLATPPNVLKEQKVQFKGFGDSTPPKIVFASPLSTTEVALLFDEVLSPLSAAAATSYKIAGLTVASVEFAGDANRKNAAFSALDATFVENVVVLKTSKMTAGNSYTVTPSGVTDLSNNACKNKIAFKAVSVSPTVDVVFTYRVSGSTTVAGKIPARAISPATLAAEREGVFMLGSTVSTDGLTKGNPKDPVNVQLGNFPPQGQPLTGLEPQLKDNGKGADAKAGDNIYTIRIKKVPLGSCIQWKAFASYKVGKSSFADALPGPALFSDGQEFPGNENAVRILGDKNGDGVVRIGNVFGNEITYKKFTNKPPFVWVVDDVTWKP